MWLAKQYFCSIYDKSEQDSLSDKEILSMVKGIR